jgi:hypothetical protein
MALNVRRHLHQKKIVSEMATFTQQSHRFRVGDDTSTMISDSQEYAPTIEMVFPLLGDRKGQRFAVAAAVATEVSGEVGRSVHDNLGGTGR